jgi:hypothetical protein
VQNVQAKVEIEYRTDTRGWVDATVVAPVGGNPGTTLGEQRRIAIKHALSQWEKRLDGSVPIALEVNLEALGCEDGATVLGYASNLSWYAALDGPGADPSLVYPSALANQLMGRDLDTDRPDVSFTVNLSVDEECRELTGGFYYGLDGQPGDSSDFVQVVLHEIAHGLGLTHTLDPKTGDSLLKAGMGIDAYGARLRDLDLDRAWSQLSRGERLRSMQNVRRVVFDGPRTAQLAAGTLAEGDPTVTFEPAVSGLSGFVADSNLGPLPLQQPMTAPLYALRNCELPAQISRGRVLLAPLRCTRDPDHLAQIVEQTQAAGVLLTTASLGDLPPFPFDSAESPHILKQPVYVLAASDAELVRQALTQAEVQVRFESNRSRQTGADDKHRPFVFISRPNAPGSSIAHLDPLVRPDQLMEPTFSAVPSHDLSMTASMLADIGWSARCGDGTLAAGERCDEGPQNSDSRPDRCRSDCSPARCGDGVQDTRESCDLGASNSDTTANGCRTDCRAAHCGDGVLDRGERCDDGAKNDDHAPNACRKDCNVARCGDHVVDRNETCDDGPDNSDTRPNQCRKNCAAPRCGDALLDRDEACDDGSQNSDRTPDACRTDCTPARCGDGVVDADEACDGSEDCTDHCQTFAAALTEAQARATGAAEDSGCGCHTLSSRRTAPWGWLAALSFMLAARRCLRREQNAESQPQF